MLVLLGGSGTPQLVQGYNTTTRRWVKYPDLPDQRSYMGCIALPDDDKEDGGRILVAGGRVR